MDNYWTRIQGLELNIQFCNGNTDKDHCAELSFYDDPINWRLLPGFNEAQQDQKFIATQEKEVPQTLYYILLSINNSI